MDMSSTSHGLLDLRSAWARFWTAYRVIWEFSSLRRPWGDDSGCARCEVAIIYWQRGLHFARHDWHDFRSSPPE